MLKINCKEETERIVKFIKETFKEKGFTKAVLGISGGLDSAVVCALLVKILGKKNVYGLMLPHGEQSDLKDSQLVCDKFDIEWDIRNIEVQVKSFCSTSGTKKSSKEDDLRIGNIMARVRMINLYDASAYWNALVVGTGNKTELKLGYFTMYGDGACALEPIGHLYKTQVRQLAKYLGIPKKIIDKAPSAGLWEGQTDEKELGMTYEEIDKFLMSYFIFPEDFAEYDKKYEFLVKRIKLNKFKMELPKCLN